MPHPVLTGSTTGYDCDVAVIGLGPVGITLCNLLAQNGLSVLGVDAAAGIYALPRAMGMDHEVMRVFQQIGIAEALEPSVGVYRASEYRTADGRLLRRLESPAEPWPLAWPPYLTFNQPELEACLRAQAGTAPGVTLRTSTELVALGPVDAPELTLRDIGTGQTDTVRPHFVVGCDGGNSFVRQALDIAFEDLVFDEPWLVIDMLLDSTVENLPDINIQYCDPLRPHTHVVGPRNLRRWEFMILPGETREEVNTQARIWQFLSPWLKPGEARIWRSATYRFHALVAREWRRGKVFLAGDACHMTPPFLAQGMVQGIKDSVNLAWKLAAVLRDGRPEALLDSYEAERRPLVHEVISITKGLGRIICELDPAEAAARDERMAAEVDRGQGLVIRQNLFPAIADGIVGRADDGTVLASAGGPSPQPVVTTPEGEARLDDVLGGGFHLLVGGDAVLSDETARAANDLGIAIHRIASGQGAGIVERDGIFRDWLRRHDAMAVLVRPDRVVFGAAGSDAEVRALIVQLRLHLEGA
ncbi:MAG: bifunctional 3-(3-hydroxy-phenyl)propionate/3-hydroxycinnamic acid hydroxylase [Paracoccus sp. (in: a-proteobacteria)]|nr:bifunctional 3-(3-hydroxy-phenyl)propionate/3-hydroxycinnamic acid hydroxylase [Paracoccus sp. (in: a-proteobacteria)]